MAPSPSIPSWLLLGAALRALVGCGPAATNERVEARAPLTVVPPGAGTDLHPVPSTTPVAPEACRYETASYGFLQGSVTLRRDRGAPAFATLRQGGLSLEVKRRSPLSATGEVRSHGLVLEGTMHPDDAFKLLEDLAASGIDTALMGILAVDSPESREIVEKEVMPFAESLAVAGR